MALRDWVMQMIDIYQDQIDSSYTDQEYNIAWGKWQAFREVLEAIDGGLI